ncbi:MAG: GNAT family N-acetyltransferase, partial [Woeseia sp.]|nr:GNAT family N-acetyltransferase [Woeseia sp.]
GAAVVAVDTVRGKEKIIGIARARLTASGKAAGFAVAILKEWRGKGIGSQLLRALIASAALAGVRRLKGYVQRDNVAMLAVARQLGFVATKCHEQRGTCKLTKSLRRDFAVQRREAAPCGSGLRKLISLREKLADLRRRLAASARTVWQ